MLRPTTPADTPALVALAAATGVFKPIEIDALHEVLDDYHAANHGYGHQSLTWDEGGAAAGFVYFAPTAMTDRTWEVWWIAVAPGRQGTGVGGRMMAFVERAVRDAGAPAAVDRDEFHPALPADPPVLPQARLRRRGDRPRLLRRRRRQGHLFQAAVGGIRRSAAGRFTPRFRRTSHPRSA